MLRYIARKGMKYIERDDFCRCLPSFAVESGQIGRCKKVTIEATLQSQALLDDLEDYYVLPWPNALTNL